jgi:hypothetical protein
MNGSSIDGRTYLKTELAGAANIHCLTTPIVPQIRENRNPESCQLGRRCYSCAIVLMCRFRQSLFNPRATGRLSTYQRYTVN